MSAEDNRRIVALAGQRAVHRAFAWLHLHEAQMRRWQMEFLRIAAPPFGEGPRGEWFAGRFGELGLERVRVDAAENVCGELVCGELGSDAGPVVLVSAHLDTVFPAGTDCTPREETPGTGAIACPGACDNGAGLAALLGVAAALQAAKVVPACTVLFAANTGEEGEGDLRGMRHLFGESEYAGRVQAAIALEGGGTAAVVDRALGSRRLRVTVTGPGGHSWADAGRANPIVALSAALVEMAKLKLPASPRTTVNCGTIAGGTSVNSIPESVTAQIEVRSTSALELDRTELAVLGLLERAVGPAGGLRLTAERIGDRPVGTLAAGSPLMASLRAVDRHLGLKTETQVGSTDANLPLSKGVPALAMGAGGVGTGIHTLAETYDPAGRDVALRRVVLLLLDVCGRVAGL